MRVIAAFCLVVATLAAGCGPDDGASSGSSGSNNPPPPACSPVAEPTLTALAIRRGDGSAYAAGQAVDTVRGGQGLTMAHFTLRLTGSVPNCIMPFVAVGSATRVEPLNVSPGPDGVDIDYVMGPIDSSVLIRASIGGLDASVTVDSGNVTAVR
jgi:hypothetical protein